MKCVLSLRPIRFFTEEWLRFRVKWGVVLVTFALWGAAPYVSRGQNTSAAAPTVLSATDATAAYLLNFVRFTEWPASVRPDKGEPYVLGVSGNPELQDALIRLVEGQRVRERSLRVVRVKHPEDVSACHLIYLEPVLPDMGLRLLDALELVKGKPVLTLSTAAGFIKAGGSVQLFAVAGRLRFSIASETARLSGLALHSRLLALAVPLPKEEESP